MTMKNNNKKDLNAKDIGGAMLKELKDNAADIVCDRIPALSGALTITGLALSMGGKLGIGIPMFACGTLGTGLTFSCGDEYTGSYLKGMGAAAVGGVVVFSPAAAANPEKFACGAAVIAGFYLARKVNKLYNKAVNNLLENTR